MYHLAMRLPPPPVTDHDHNNSMNSIQQFRYTKKGYRDFIIRLAKYGKFDDIERLYTTSIDDEIICNNLKEYLNECITLYGETPLHTILKYRPPVTLIDLICIWLNTHRPEYSPEDAVDRQGKTPLHIAVIYVCDIRVIERLMNGSLSCLCAKTMDRSHRRYALHYACANPNGIYNSRKYNWIIKKKINNMVQIICRLAEIYPTAISVRDKDGYTPIDLARLHNKTDKRIKAALINGALIAVQQPKSPMLLKNNYSPTVVTWADSLGSNDAQPWEIVIHNNHSHSAAADHDDDDEDYCEEIMDDTSSLGSNGISVINQARRVSTGKIPSNLVFL